MTSICFVNLPQERSLDPALDVPLGLLYVAAAARDAGCEISFVDFAFSDATLPFADIYAMTIMTTSYNAAIRVRDLGKSINPECLVMVGGPHPTAMPEETAKDFDIVVPGEGEWVVQDIIKDKRYYPHIAARQPITDVDTLRMPARDIVLLKEYNRRVGDEQATSIITARGCSFRCAFCSSSIMFDRVRYRDPDAVVYELEMLRDFYGFKSFVFYDDTFVLNRKRLYPMLDKIKPMGITFRCNGRAGYNTYEDFVRLKEAGCHTVSFGIESGSQAILDKINKMATVQSNREAIRDAQRAGLVAKAFLIVGLPGETDETVEETMRFIDESDPDCYTLFTFVPYPGTQIWNHREDFGVEIIEQDWDKFYVIAEQGVGGIVLQTDTYSPEKLAEMRNRLLEHLKRRRWGGTVEQYEQNVTWRNVVKTKC
jgi:radical SAM superfamily enzyme YgiQ (UPF0313 family)